MEKFDSKVKTHNLKEIITDGENCNINSSYPRSKNYEDNLTEAELESIERRLKDFKEGRIHSHKSAKDIYCKYL